MKQIVCEMCGGSDLVKQDGMFICQTCGTKYSIEEAKKLMIEITEPIVVKNNPQIDSLLILANSSFNSKNYAQAEASCNQIIAMDSLNYEAWKLKGIAINYQITGNNDRILEVYNCLMTAYRNVDDDKKFEKRDEILTLLKECLEGEIVFSLKLLKDLRPTIEVIEKVKNTYSDLYEKMGLAFDEFDLKDEKENYLMEFTNYFIKETNNACSECWETTVGYNYYRNKFNNKENIGFSQAQLLLIEKQCSNNETKCSSNETNSQINELTNSYNINKFLKEYALINDPFFKDSYEPPMSGFTIYPRMANKNDDYRPQKETFFTFITEIDNIIDLLQFAISKYNEETNPYDVEKIYNNMILYENCAINSTYWDEQYIDFVRKYKWVFHGSLDKKAQEIRLNRILKHLKNKKEIPEFLKKIKKIKKVNKYWEEHSEEKARLEEEKKSLYEKRTVIKSQINEINQKNKNKVNELNKNFNKRLPCEVEVDNQIKIILDLKNQKNNCNIFKLKLKKSIQKQIDEQEIPKLERLVKQAKEEKINYQKSVNEELENLNNENKELIKEIKTIENNINDINTKLNLGESTTSIDSIVSLFEFKPKKLNEPVFKDYELCFYDIDKKNIDLNCNTDENNDGQNKKVFITIGIVFVIAILIKIIQFFFLW